MIPSQQVGSGCLTDWVLCRAVVAQDRGWVGPAFESERRRKTGEGLSWCSGLVGVRAWSSVLCTWLFFLVGSSRWDTWGSWASLGAWSRGELFKSVRPGVLVGGGWDAVFLLSIRLWYVDCSSLRSCVVKDDSLVPPYSGRTKSRRLGSRRRLAENQKRLPQRESRIGKRDIEW